MEVTFGLSPIVYAELYDMLNDHRDEMQPRLELLARDSEWVSTMSHWYRLLWQYRLDTSSTAKELHGQLGPEHGDLATWLLSSFHGECDSFSRELRKRSAVHLVAAEEQGAPAAGAYGQPAVISWSLGAVPGQYDRELPVVFAESVPDRHLRMAYQGLVEHLVDMGDRGEPWPEVASSAVLWRCASLAEGLAPGDNLMSSLKACMEMVRGLLPDSAWRRVRTRLEEFKSHRNALTHLGEVGGTGFADLHGRYERREELTDLLTAVTAFVGSSVRSAMQEGSDQGRQAMSNRLEDEMSWLEDYLAA